MSTVTKLSAKGQLVIPKEIRQTLDLKPGARFEVDLVEGQIILRPLVDKAALEKTIDSMRRVAGKPGALDDLEAEHRREIDQDRTRERSFPAR